MRSELLTGRNRKIRPAKSRDLQTIVLTTHGLSHTGVQSRLGKGRHPKSIEHPRGWEQPPWACILAIVAEFEDPRRATLCATPWRSYCTKSSRTRAFEDHGMRLKRNVVDWDREFLL